MLFYCFLNVVVRMQASPAHFKSELVSFQKVQRTTMLDHLDPVCKPYTLKHIY
jgi:hypothetical protein